MRSLRYRVICSRFDEHVTFDFDNKRAAVEVERAMKKVGYRVNWYSYLPAAESQVLS